jgi:hypothetical protein
MKKLQTLAADGNRLAVAEKHSALHVENEPAKCEPVGHAPSLATFCKISELFGADFKTLRTRRAILPSLARDH